MWPIIENTSEMSLFIVPVSLIFIVLSLILYIFCVSDFSVIC
jgi:hypothetical protein